MPVEQKFKTFLLAVFLTSQFASGCDSKTYLSTPAPVADIGSNVASQSSSQKAVTSGQSAARPFDIVQLGEDCNVWLAGGGNKIPPLYSGEEDIGGCMVIVPNDELLVRYKYCAVSSIILDPAKNGRLRACDFDIYDDSSIYFRNYPTEQACRFVCVK